MKGTLAQILLSLDDPNVYIWAQSSLRKKEEEDLSLFQIIKIKKSLSGGLRLQSAQRKYAPKLILELTELNDQVPRRS